MTALDLTVGALEIGILLSTVLYGILTVQAYQYWERKSRESAWIPVMVACVWILETVHTVFLWIFLYILTVTNYGKPETINDIPWSFAMTFPLSAWLGSITQIFFAWRVKILSPRIPFIMLIPIAAWIGSLLRCALGTTAGGLLISSHSIPAFFARYQWIATTPFVLNVIVDVMNTAALCWCLLRRRAVSRSTQRVVDKLVVFTVETGLITSIFALAIAICSSVLHDNTVYMGLFMIYPKLFSNSLFTSLNSRESMRQHAEHNTTSRRTTGESNTERPTVTLELSIKPPAHSLDTSAYAMSSRSVDRDGDEERDGSTKVGTGMAP